MIVSHAEIEYVIVSCYAMIQQTLASRYERRTVLTSEQIIIIYFILRKKKTASSFSWENILQEIGGSLVMVSHEQIFLGALLHASAMNSDPKVDPTIQGYLVCSILILIPGMVSISIILFLSSEVHII